MKLTKYVLVYLFMSPFMAFSQWYPSSYTNISSLKAASFLNKDSFIVNMNGRVFQTKNAGETFDSFPSYPNQLVLNLVYKSPDTLFVARENTKGLLCSYDAGKNWVTQTLLMPNGDTAFKDGKIGFLGFFDHHRGVIFGDTLNGIQQVFLTQDGGRNWDFHVSSASLLFRVPSSSRGKTAINSYLFASGIGKLIVNDSKMLTLINYGREWYVDSVLPVNQSYSSIAFKDELNGLARISIPLRGPVPFRTSDGGSSWTELADSAKKSDGNLLYVKPTPKHMGFYLASTPKSSGESNVSYDDGNTWQLFDTLNHGSGTVFFRDAETGVCSELSFTGSPLYYYKPSTVGLKEITQSSKSALYGYPNPTSDKVNFSMVYQSLELYDTQGRLVCSFAKTDHIDVSGIQNGLYWIKATDSRAIQYTQKLLIQH